MCRTAAYASDPARHGAAQGVSSQPERYRRALPQRAGRSEMGYDEIEGRGVEQSAVLVTLNGEFAAQRMFDSEQRSCKPTCMSEH